MKSTRLLFVLTFAVAAHGAVIDSSRISSKITQADTVADIDATFFMASLKVLKNLTGPEDWLHFCGGCLISSQFIFTAAQCIIILEERFEPDSNNVAAFMGNLNLNGRMTRYDIKNFRRHNGYNPNDKFNTAANDIGVILLRKEIEPPDQNKIVYLGKFHNCLSFGMTIGWGYTRRSTLRSVFSNSFRENHLAKQLRGLTIVIWTGKGDIFFRGVVNGDEENLLWGYGPNADEDNSVGDAGNPLIVKYNHVKYLAGITAYVPSRTVHVPNFFVSTEFHLPWIYQVTDDLLSEGRSQIPTVASGSNPEVITLPD